MVWRTPSRNASAPAHADPQPQGRSRLHRIDAAALLPQSPAQWTKDATRAFSVCASVSGGPSQRRRCGCGRVLFLSVPPPSITRCVPSADKHGASERHMRCGGSTGHVLASEGLVTNRNTACRHRLRHSDVEGLLAIDVDVNGRLAEGSGDGGCGRFSIATTFQPSAGACTCRAGG